MTSAAPGSEGSIASILKPVKPQSSVINGLAMLKIANGRYTSVGTASTAAM